LAGFLIGYFYYNIKSILINIYCKVKIISYKCYYNAKGALKKRIFNFKNKANNLFFKVKSIGLRLVLGNLIIYAIITTNLVNALLIYLIYRFDLYKLETGAAIYHNYYFTVSIIVLSSLFLIIVYRFTKYKEPANIKNQFTLLSALILVSIVIIIAIFRGEVILRAYDLSKSLAIEPKLYILLYINIIYLYTTLASCILFSGVKSFENRFNILVFF